MSRIFSLSFVVTVALAGVSCQSSSQPGNSDSAYSDSVISRITKVRQYITEGTPSEVASVFSYPVLRPYPLRDVVDSSAMVDYISIMVDDSLKTIISSVAPDQWQPLGWRGYTPTEDGDVLLWDGGIYDFSYLSKQELELKSKLSCEEMQSLHPSLRKGWQPYYCMLSPEDGTLYRIDIAENDTTENGEGILRLMAYKSHTPLSSMPVMNLTGHVVTEGSEGNRVIHFSSGDTTLDFIFDRSDDSRSQIDIVKGGEYKTLSVNPVYWRDYLPDGTYNRAAR